MKIVVEYVLFENFLINLIILKTTSLILKEKGRFFWLSAFLGACFAVAMPVFYLSVWGYLLLEMSLVVWFVCVSFKFKTLKKFLTIYLCYFVATFLYGGACYFVERLFGIKSLLVVLAIIVSVYIVVKILDKKRTRKKMIENFCFDVEVKASGKIFHLKGFLDSGNLLYDPLTQKPVCLLSFKVFSQMFEDISLEDIIKRSEKIKQLKLAHYISFNTLNCTDKILVFQVESLKVGNSCFEKATFGLSFKSFEGAFGSDIILHNNFAMQKA